MSSLSSCRACGNDVPAGMPSCGWCGARLTGAEPSETINVHEIERRLFGVPPATGLLVGGSTAIALAIYLLLAGRPLVGVVVLLAGLLLLAIFPGIARRPGETPVARQAARSYDGLRERASATVESVAARAEERRRLLRLVDEIAHVEGARAEAIRLLGEGAYAGDEREVERRRRDVAAADAVLASKRTEIEQVRRRTDERVREARLRSQPTQRLQREETGALTATVDDAAP